MKSQCTDVCGCDRRDTDTRLYVDFSFDSVAGEKSRRFLAGLETSRTRTRIRSRGKIRRRARHVAYSYGVRLVGTTHQKQLDFFFLPTTESYEKSTETCVAATDATRTDLVARK